MEKNHPMSPVQLLLKPSTWVKFVCFFFLLVFSRFLPPWPKNAPKPMEKQKNNPMSPVQLLLRPSPWVNFFCVFLFSRGFCHLGPKTHQNQWKKQKESTRVTCPASPQTLSMGRNCFFCCFGSSRFLPLCQSNNISCSFFLCFLFSCPLGS